MIVIIGYNVVQHPLGVVLNKIRFSKFSRPWVTSDLKLEEFRELMLNHWKKEYGDGIRIDLFSVKPDDFDFKYRAIKEFLDDSKGKSSMTDIAKKYQMSTNDLRKLLAEYIKRMNYANPSTQNNKG